MFRFLLNFFFIFSILTGPAFCENITVFEFTKNELKDLKVKKVKKLTTYMLGSNEKGNYLRAEAEGVGSGLGKEVKIDLNKTPFINITWKVERDLRGIDEKSKKGHDYAARVFVVKKTGLTALSNKAKNYIFSSWEILSETNHKLLTTYQFENN